MRDSIFRLFFVSILFAVIVMANRAYALGHDYIPPILSPIGENYLIMGGFWTEEERENLYEGREVWWLDYSEFIHKAPLNFYWYIYSSHLFDESAPEMAEAIGDHCKQEKDV